MGTTNTFSSLQPNLKESYVDSKKKRFGKLKSAMKSPKKATAELEASKNPQKFLADKSYLNLKGKKGIAI